MLKKILLVSLAGVSALFFTAAPLRAEEMSQQGRSEMGIRSLPVEEQVAHQKARASQELAENNPAARSTAVKQVQSRSCKSLSGGIYYTVHPGAYHYPTSISSFGDTVGLEDGSVWTVSAADMYKIGGWYSNDVVVITPNHSWFSSYQYVITNQTTQDAVAANLYLAPFYRGEYTHWIMGIDYYNNVVYLEDGSRWWMSAFDSVITDRWYLGDTVIIGVNDSLFSSSRPNILINVSTLDYAAGSVTY